MKPLKTFYQKIDRRSRKKMTDFLVHHFRYDTMSSWNLSTSWANNLKIHKVIPNSLQDKVFELMETDEYSYEIRDAIACYDSEHLHELQAGFNGRSGGYLVMYQGGMHPNRSTFCYPGKSIDNNLDYEDLDINTLRNIVSKVQRFDQLCDEIVQITIDMANNCTVADEEYTVIKTRKVLV